MGEAKTTHTPSPWIWRLGMTEVVDKDGLIICEFALGLTSSDARIRDTSQRNFQLISSAPDLFDALVDIAENGYSDEDRAKARAAIARYYAKKT